MRKFLAVSMAAAFLAALILPASDAEAGRRYRGPGIAVSTGGFAISTGGYSRPGRHYGSPGLAVRVGPGFSGRGYAYGRRGHRGYDTRHYRPAAYGRAGGVAVSLSGYGRGGYVGVNLGSGYGPVPYGRPYGSYGQAYRPGGSAVIITAPYGYAAPHMTRTWIPGRRSGYGYSRGHWEVRPLRWVQ
jgi:hypothetical protein